MSAVLTTWQGRPACEIAAADGEVWTYCWTAKRLARGGWQICLEKVENGDIAFAYRIVLYTSGSWDCDCADAKYRRGKCNSNDPPGCKHVLAARELAQVLTAIGVGTEEMENGNWIRKVTN